MKRVIQSLLLMITLPLFISVIVWLIESRINEVIQFFEGIMLGFLNIFYASPFSVIYTSIFDIRFSWHIADYIIFFASYEWLLILLWQFIVDFLLLYIFYYFNKTKKIYIYAISIVILKIVFAYTFGVYLV